MFVNLNIVAGERLGEREHRPALLLGQQRQRDREEQAEDDDLQHVAFRHGLRDVLGEGVQHHVGRATAAAGASREGCSASGAWMPTPGLRRG